MGVRQSKRSVDITTKDGEPTKAALDGKLASIEEGANAAADLKAKLANGHADGNAEAKVRESTAKPSPAQISKAEPPSYWLVSSFF